MLGKMPGAIKSVRGDGAYDGQRFRKISSIPWVTLQFCRLDPDLIR